MTPIQVNSIVVNKIHFQWYSVKNKNNLNQNLQIQYKNRHLGLH